MWEALADVWPWLLVMAVLAAFSGFFSGSEAALFSLKASERSAMAGGRRGQRVAAWLLADPERLLSAVLFWNLVVNMTYFAVSSICTIRLQRSLDESAAGAFALVTLMVLIFFSEMLPKSVAVMRPRFFASLVSMPMAVAVRAADPLMPVLQFLYLLSRRLVWPRFKAEPYIEVSDLERAIEHSTSDEQLVEQEQAMLRNIVMMSDIRVDEWMRPRTQFLSFQPPVSLAHLNGKMTPSGYLLVTDPKSEEIAGSIHLRDLSELPSERIERYAEPVVYVPWCATVADALQQLRSLDRDVAAVVNEFGETIGILTFEDILDTVFTYSPSRSKRLLDRNPIHVVEPGVWLVAGVTGLRRLSASLGFDLPPSKSVTVAGIVQETLGRLAQEGDQCEWGPFHFRVLEVLELGHMLFEMKLKSGKEAVE